MEHRISGKWHLISTWFLLLTFAVPAIGGGFAALKNEGDRHWEKRDDQAFLLKAIEFYSKALELSPENEGLLTRLSIACYWKGDGFSKKEKKKRKEAYITGVGYAKTLCALNSNSVEGNFWIATNRASYGREVGFLRSAFLLPELNRRMKIVMDQERHYYHGGPQRLMARVIYHAPGFFRGGAVGTLEDAERMLKEAIQAEPNFTLSRLFLADIYWKMKKPDLARQALERVLAVAEGALPDFEADNRKDKEEARERLKEYFKK